jgi:hypothetical protein
MANNTRALWAEIDAADGKAEFTGLWQGDRRVAARSINTKFGSRWLLADSEEDLLSEPALRDGRPSKWRPTGEALVRWNVRQILQQGFKKRPLVERRELAPAAATVVGDRWNATAVVFRTGDKDGQDAELI